MNAGYILAAIALLGVCSAQTSQPALGGIPLSTSFLGFTSKYPRAVCNGDPQFRSCRVDGLAIAGVPASRTDFNFASAILTSINLVFDPIPSDEQLTAIETELTRLYGPPARREITTSHRLHESWENGPTRLLLNVGLDRTIVILENKE